MGCPKGVGLLICNLPSFPAEMPPPLKGRPKAEQIKINDYVGRADLSTPQTGYPEDNITGALLPGIRNFGSLRSDFESFKF